MTGAEQGKRRRARMLDYFRPRAATMLLLGFSSGLPFLLTGNTLGYWLRDEGTSLTAIGFLSWVGIAYSLKPIWAPVIDRVDAPFFGRLLGRRRGWMLVAQLLVCLGLIAMSAIGPRGGVVLLGACALLVAFASSSQDIVVDAWRIEVADNPDELGLLSSAYQLGYRAALLLTDALILIAAGHFGWPISYGLMAALMAVGFIATWKATEPRRAEAAAPSTQAALPLWTPRGFLDAVVGPFSMFFRTYGSTALLMLLMISLYRLPDFIMGPMANPFYHDVGLSKDVVGGVRASVGLVFSLLGVAAGGLSCVRFGYLTTLITGAVLQGFAVSSFALLAYYGAQIERFSAVMAADNFATSFAGVALVTYMSSLTTLGYTATQYALLSSTYAYLGKIMKGSSGAIVEYLSSHGHTLMDAYGIFFIGAGAIGLPALVLCVVLARQQRVASRIGSPDDEVAAAMPRRSSG
jgi:PAT family beta-lactamase induction signal transducer AmpG